MNAATKVAISAPFGDAIDPLLAWAEATGFRDYFGIAGNQNPFIHVVVECADDESVGKLIKKVDAFVTAATLPTGSVTFSPLYQKLPKHLTNIRFCSAHVQLSVLAQFRPLVKRLELSQAIETSRRNSSGIDLNGIGSFLEVMDKRTVVGFIDDFLAFQNPIFSKNFQLIWSQDKVKPSKSAEWKSVKNDYGYLLENPQKQGTYPAVQHRISHGTHVASVAAGKRKFQESVNEQTNDAASNAALVGVHFPKSTLQDTSGGAMAGHVLDGIHFILRAAADASYVRPAVVNLSYGTFAGAHDGESILEQAIDELVGCCDAVNAPLAVVVPAGNQYESKCHAKFGLDESRREQTLNWQVLPDDGTPSFVEIWFAPGDEKLVDISLEPPSGKPLGSADVSNQVFNSALSAAIIFPTKHVGSHTRTSALIAIAPTRLGSSVKSEHGVWKIKIALKKDVPTSTWPIHAWIERDDAISGYRRLGRQSFFIDAAYKKYRESYGQPSDMTASVVKRSGSFNSIANGKHSFVAGGYVRNTLEIAAYSGGSPCIAANPTGPDIVAVSECSQTSKGIPGAGIFGVDTLRMNGTSVAAPQLTRWIVNWIARNPGQTTAQIRMAVSSMVLKLPPVGPFPPVPVVQDRTRDGAGRLIN